MTNRTLILTLITLFIFTGIALGGYDLAGSAGAEKLSMSDSIVQSLETDTGSAIADAMAPQVPATQPGSQQLALYISQTPIETDLQGLMPFNVKVSPSTNVFYKGSYLGWNRFTSQFPSTSAGLWIERSVGWSWYATTPLGGWSRELLYVPFTSPIFMYEIYPSGFVTGYNLGVVQPGYYYLWYCADTPGRHLDVFGTSSGYSNKVIIDVYSTIPVPRPVPPKPVPPDPQKECEKVPYCHWVNGQCLCTMPPVSPDPQKECEKVPYCHWVNGQCLCTMPPVSPDPQKECEKTPGCFWADGQCQCPPGPVPNPTPEPMPGPVPNPVNECEKTPGCFWADGQCQCPPGPVPNPNPDEGQGNNA